MTINGLLDGRLIFTTEQEWTFGGVYKSMPRDDGALVVYSLK